MTVVSEIHCALCATMHFPGPCPEREPPPAPIVPYRDALDVPGRLYPEPKPGDKPKPLRPICAKCDQPCEELLEKERQVDEGVQRLVAPTQGMRRIAWTGTCKLHGELEFSARWQKRCAAVGNDEKAQKRLMLERVTWEAAGHTYRGVTAAPALRVVPASSPHMATCNCPSCRTAREDEERANSLWPEGQP